MSKRKKNDGNDFKKNPLLAGSGGGSGPALNPLVATAGDSGSGLASNPLLAPGSKAAQPKKAKPRSLLGQATDLTTGVFGGVIHAGGALYTDLNSAVGDVGGSLGNITHPSQWFSTKDPIIRSLTPSGWEEAKKKYPLTTGQLESMSRTGGGLVDTASVPFGKQSFGASHYGKAIKEGHILGTAVEDLANASIVLAPAAKAFTVAGSFADAARVAKLGEVAEGLDAANAARPGALTQTGAFLKQASHLGAEGAAGPAKVWTAIPKYAAQAIRAGGELTGFEAAAKLPTFAEAAIRTGEGIAARYPEVEKQFPRLTARGRDVAAIIRAGRGDVGEATRESRIGYERAVEETTPTKAEAKAILAEQPKEYRRFGRWSDTPTRRAIKRTQAEEAIIAQQAGAMVREGTARPLTYLPEDVGGTAMAEMVTGPLTPDQAEVYGIHPKAAETARSYLMGTLSPEAAARVEGGMRPMSRLAGEREAAGLERGTIHPEQLGYDYLRPPGPTGYERQQAFADELHGAYQEHVATTGAENVTLADLYPKMADRYGRATGEAYTREKYASDVHDLALSDVEATRSGAPMELTGSTGHQSAGAPEGVLPRSTVTAEPTAWTRPSYYGVRFGEEAAIPNRLRPMDAATQRVHQFLTERAGDETLHPMDREIAAQMADEIPRTLDEYAAHASNRAEAGMRGDVEHLIGGGESVTTSGKGQGGPFARRVRKFGEQTQAETTLTQRGAREQAILDANRRGQFIRDKTAQDIGGKYGADPEALLGKRARTMKPDQLEKAMLDEHGKVKLPLGAGQVAWVDPAVKAAFDREWKDPGQQFGMKLLSRGNRAWKMTVLPLSPRWHLGNIVGNMMMATVGAGVDPVTLAKSVLDARNELKYGDPRAFPGRLTTSSVAEGERRAMGLGGVGAEEGNAAQRFINRSYQFNTTVDDLGRSAVYLAKKGQGYSEEEAIKIALKAMGDFDKMTPFERNVVREVIPFYAWARHITQLTLRLPVENPMRVAWMLHLSDQYSDDQSVLPAFLKGSAKVAGRYLPGSSLNPFSDITRSPFLDPASLAAGVTPFVKVPVQQLSGIDMSRGLKQTTRGESMGGRDARGTLIPGPLPINALPNLVVNQIPLARLARDVVPLPGVQSWGTPGGRLGSGEPYVRNRKRVGQVSRPEAVARALLPWPRVVTDKEIREANRHA